VKRQGPDPARWTLLAPASLKTLQAWLSPGKKSKATLSKALNIMDGSTVPSCLKEARAARTYCPPVKQSALSLP